MKGLMKFEKKVFKILKHRIFWRLLIAPTVLISSFAIGTAGILTFGVCHGLATPFIEGYDISQQIHTGSIEKWTCCGREGSWAEVCMFCTDYVQPKKKRKGMLLTSDYDEYGIVEYV